MYNYIDSVMGKRNSHGNNGRPRKNGGGGHGSSMSINRQVTSKLSGVNVGMDGGKASSNFIKAMASYGDPGNSNR